MRKTILFYSTLVVATILLVACGDDEPKKVDPVDPIIASFSITSPVAADGTINGTNINVTVPAGTDVTAMTVEVVVPVGATVTPASGSTVDFTSPVTFTVTGNDEDDEEVIADYTVTVELLAPTKIGFLSMEGAEANVSETDAAAAMAWFQTMYGDDFKFVPLGGIVSGDLADVKVLNFYWDYTHDGPDTEWGDISFPRGIKDQFAGDIAVVKTWVENGGQLVLAGTATQFVAELGLMTEETLPTIYWGGTAAAQGDRPADDVWTMVTDHDVAGLAAERGSVSTTDWDRTSHPAFDGLAYIDQATDSRGFDYPTLALNNANTREDHNSMWDLNKPEIADAVGWDASTADFWDRGDKFEETFNAKILGSWGQVVDFCCAAMIEFMPDAAGGGSVIAIGAAAYDWDTTVDVNETDPGLGNEYQSNIEGLTENCVDYLSDLADENFN